MTDSEPKGWRKYLRRERHVGSETVIYHGENPFTGSEKKEETGIELNKPGNMLRQNQDGSFDKAQRHVTPKPVTLDSSLQTKNRIP